MPGPRANMTSFTVAWSGTDDPAGTGIATFSVYVSDNGGAFQPLLIATTATSTTFTGQNGHTYGFYSTATDLADNVQPTPSTPQAATRIDTVAPTSSVGALPAITNATSFTLTWSGTDDPGGSGIASYDVAVSTDGGAFVPFLTRTTQTLTTFSGSPGHSYAFYSIATDKTGNRQPTPSSAQAATQLVAPPVSVPPAVIQFGSVQFAVNVNAGSTSIILTRVGNFGTTVTVVLSSPGGQASRRSSRSISFAPNVTSQSVSIPISNDLLPGRSDVVIPLTLSSPGDGAALGGTATASLVIHDDNPPLVVVSSAKTGNVIPPGKGKKAKKTTGIVIQFSGSLNSTQASSLAAFHVFSGKVKKGHTTFSKPVLLSSAIYNASAHTVSLLPKSKLNLAQPEQLRVTAALLTDAYGRPIDGNHDGQPGGDAVITITKKGITIAMVESRSRVASLTAAAVDSLLETGQIVSSRRVASHRQHDLGWSRRMHRVRDDAPFPRP